MPTYEYECQDCHERVEAVQKFSDPALTVCPKCGGGLRKLFSAVGIAFKGSGFYKNDSRPAPKGKTASTTTSEAAKKEPASTTSSSTATPSTPTAAD